VTYGDGATEMALANSLGVEATSRRCVCSVSALTLAGEGVDTRTGYGFSVGRELAELDVEDAARMAAERAVRLLGATQPKSRKLAVVFDPLVASSILGVISGALNGESMLKGRSMFAVPSGSRRRDRGDTPRPPGTMSPTLAGPNSSMISGTLRNCDRPHTAPILAEDKTVPRLRGEERSRGTGGEPVGEAARAGP
jgi:hypothetical protein